MEDVLPVLLRALISRKVDLLRRKSRRVSVWFKIMQHAPFLDMDAPSASILLSQSVHLVVRVEFRIISNLARQKRATVHVHFWLKISTRSSEQGRSVI